MSEKEVEIVDLTGDDSRDEIAGEESRDEAADIGSRDKDLGTPAAEPISVSEVQSALEQVDLGEEEEAGESREQEGESRDDELEPVDQSRDLEDESEDVIEADVTETTKDTEENEDTKPDIASDTTPIELETKEVLEMTEDGEVDEEQVKEAVKKEEQDIDGFEDNEEEEKQEENEAESESRDHLPVPEAPKSESSFGEFASEDEFGDFDDFEEMEETEPVQQTATLDTSREETPMASQTNLSAPVSVSVKSVLSEDSFSSFTSLSFATKSVLEDNGLNQVFTEAKEPAGAKFELSESASQIYALLCSVPNSELNFLKSFTRRLLLKDVGVPLDLDELLPRKEKQHFVIRRSRRSLEKKSRDSTDGGAAGAGAGAGAGGSRAPTPTTATDSSRAQTPVTVDTELKLDLWLRLVEVRPEQRERMEQEELQEHIKQLKSANEEAKLLLKQWEEKLALGYKNKEAFEAVVENMVGFAQKQRLKKGKK